MIITTEFLPAAPTRRITLDLTEERARALARVLMDKLVWDETEAGTELYQFHLALTRREQTS